MASFQSTLILMMALHLHLHLLFSLSFSLDPTEISQLRNNCKASLQQSLEQSQKFLSSLQTNYLTDHPSTSPTTKQALEDCHLLATLNLDFFSEALETLNSSTTLRSSQASDLHSLLSATLTNTQTCGDGIITVGDDSDSEMRKGVNSLCANGTKYYSTSLANFKDSWVRDDDNAKIYPSVKNRKLLQAMEGSVNISQTVVVNPNGSGDFTTITDAVNSAPNNTAKSSNAYFVIRVVSGVYNEYVSIPKNKQNLMMIGDGINQTVITGNRSVGDGWTTFNSATFAVVAQGFVAINMTIRNTAGASKHQAVAVRNGADLSVFYKCSFEGYQDTLYTHSLRQFYRDCDIYGTVDFIFGNAAVVLQNCNIYPRQPLQGQSNPITAQGRTDPNQNTGISIHNCLITPTPDLASSNFTVKTYLGRPWKLYSRTVYMQTYMDSLIDPAGWLAWDGTFALDTLYYAEYHNSGPGSNTSNRVTWSGYHIINASDAVNFTVSNFILGTYWLPATGVPYTSGLL